MKSEKRLAELEGEPGGGDAIRLRRIKYSELTARQKENYNYQKISAILADYGFVTLRLSDDWQGADFIAQHIDGETFLRVQLKGRLTFLKSYIGRNLHIAFRASGNWYLFPHDEVLKAVLKVTSIRRTVSWRQRGGYSFPRRSRQLKELLQPYLLGGE
jgi:hypothetical protein